MYSTKQHIVRKSLIVLVSFIGGIATTVLASAVYDANVQSRATKMFTAITNNANQLDPKDVPTYYNLVHLNIQSLMQVLTSVDTSVMASLSQTSDEDVTGQVSDVTPAAPGIHGSNPVSRSTSESYMMSWTGVAGLDYYIAIDANISTGGNKATGTSWTIPLTGLTPGSTHTGALKACAANTAICSTWSTVTINIGGGGAAQNNDEVVANNGKDSLEPIIDFPGDIYCGDPSSTSITEDSSVTVGIYKLRGTGNFVDANQRTRSKPVLHRSSCTKTNGQKKVWIVCNGQKKLITDFDNLKNWDVLSCSANTITEYIANANQNTGNTGNNIPAAPTIAGSTTVSRSTNESYRMEWTRVAGLDYYTAIDASISTGGNKATGTSITIPLSGFAPGSTHTGAVKACTTGTMNCGNWSTVTIRITTQISQYPLCDTPDIKAGEYVISACNVGTTKAGLTKESYGKLFQSGKSDESWTEYSRNIDSGEPIRTPDTPSWKDGSQLPCLKGYHVPTNMEWVYAIHSFGFALHQQDTVSILQNKLKLPFAGFRIDKSRFTGYGIQGLYHTSNGLNDLYFFGPANINAASGLNVSYGKSIRCFKDTPSTGSVPESYSVSGNFGSDIKGLTIAGCDTFAVANMNGLFTLAQVPKGTNCKNITATAPGYVCTTSVDGPMNITGNITNISGSCTRAYYPGTGGAGKCNSPDIPLSNGQVWAGCNVGTNVAGEYGEYYQWGKNTPEWTKVNTQGNDINAWGNTTDTSIARKGPCATGYHVPSQGEWQSAYDDTRLADSASNSSQGSNLPALLNLSKAGYKYYADGSLQNASMNGSYWSSTSGSYFFFNGWNDIVNPNMSQTNNAYALSIRCIKN